jgi:hypothetical protein
LGQDVSEHEPVALDDRTDLDVQRVREPGTVLRGLAQAGSLRVGCGHCAWLSF